MMYFAKEENLKIISKFIKKAEAINLENKNLLQRLKTSRNIIEYIYNNPEGWDEKCRFNIKHIGDQFLATLNNFDSDNIEQINYIYCYVYRFLNEFDFFIGSGKELGFEVRLLKNRIEEDSLDGMSQMERSQMTYAALFMPANIVKEFVNNQNIESFKEFNQKTNEAVELKNKWEKEIKEKEQEIDAIRKNLEEYQVGFNFVGLYQGFENLNGEKENEEKKLFWSLIAMALVILIPLLVEVGISFAGLYKNQALSFDRFVVILPLLSIEIILIYFFRILLHNYKSVKVQRMQIQLRQTLCQFIQSYADYAMKIKKVDSTALEKFENLIFSGVLENAEKLPSTYDGIEQIGKIFKTLKNP